MKKFVSAFLALLLICCMIPPALSADQSTQAADVLYELGLFKGTGTNPDGTPIYDLGKTPTRNQAIIMLVRLLGKEDEAKAGTWDIPFTDVSDAMRPYIGYAYANGLTNGYTATTYNGGAPIKANQYITFVLRALGYESGKDFEVSSAWTLSDELGITAGQYQKGGAFTRGNVAEISWGTLSATVRGTDQVLAEKLRADGAIPKEARVLYQQDTAPEDLVFQTIPREYYGCWGYIPKYFTLKSIEYAPAGENVYFRVHYSSSTVQKFFVMPANWERSESGEMVRYAAEPASGVFTCKLPKAWFKDHAQLVIGPSEDGSTAPDYVINVGYLMLTEDDQPPVFRPTSDYIDDSYEVADFKFGSAEYAEVLGGRMYRISFTNTAYRNIQFWTLKKGQQEKFNTGLMHLVKPQAGDTGATYFVPDYVLNEYDHIYVRVRDAYAIDPNGGSCQEHCGIDIYFHGLPKGK